MLPRVKYPVPLLQLWALTKRDFYNWSTYKTLVVTELLAVAIGILAWGVNATYRNRPVSEYGTDYVSFLIVGILVGSAIMPLERSVRHRLNPWTIETIIMSGVSVPVFVLGTVSWSYLFSIMFLTPQLLIGVYWFHARLAIDLVSLVAAMLISSSIMFSLSMIETGTRLVTKTRDPISWALHTLQQLMAGMTFPVQFLDSFVPGLSTVSWLLPQTWVYHLMRLSLLGAASLSNPSVLLQFLVGILFATLLLPVSYVVFSWGMKRAKRDGTLGWF